MSIPHNGDATNHVYGCYGNLKHCYLGNFWFGDVNFQPNLVTLLFLLFWFQIMMSTDAGVHTGCSENVCWSDTKVAK